MSLIDGIELNVTPASFAEVMALEEAISKALKADGIKIDLSSVNIDLENIEKFEAGDVGWVAAPILTLVTDSAIRVHLFQCAKRALFGKDKIDVDFFDKVENRKYYYPIMMEVLKINIAPFFGLASSAFSNLPGLTELLQKLKSQPQK